MEGTIINKNLLNLKIAITDLVREILIENIYNGSLDTDFEILLSPEDETVTVINRDSNDKQVLDNKKATDTMTLKYLIAYCLFIDLGLRGNYEMLEYLNKLDTARPNQQLFYEVLDY